MTTTGCPTPVELDSDGRRYPKPADPLKANEGAFALVGAFVGDSGVPVWDDGYGKIWAVWDNCGPCGFPIGFVRARSWETAYSCAEDEVFPGPDKDDENIVEWEAACRDEEDSGGSDYPEIPEGYGYRGSGTPSNEGKFPRVNSMYYQYSLDLSNTVSLLTREVMEEHKVRLVYDCYKLERMVTNQNDGDEHDADES
jgi:hypothetical protein